MLFVFAATWMYLTISCTGMGFFISVTLYVNAFADDFKNIISEMNDEITFESKNASNQRPHDSNSTVKLKEAILLHYEMLT